MKDLRDFMAKVEELGELRVVEGANWNATLTQMTTV